MCLCAFNHLRHGFKLSNVSDFFQFGTFPDPDSCLCKPVFCCKLSVIVCELCNRCGLDIVKWDSRFEKLVDRFIALLRPKTEQVSVCDKRDGSGRSWDTS